MRCDRVRLAEVRSNTVRLGWVRKDWMSEDKWKINVVTGREPWLD